MDIQILAKDFERLFDIKYDLLLGRRNKAIEISIVFCDYDFHHLAGLHYLTDRIMLSRARDIVYWDIYNGVITDSDVRKSSAYKDIVDRLKVLDQIEHLIDTNDLIFRYSPKNNPKSKIKANFVMQSFTAGKNKAFIFLKYIDENRKQVCCNSIFPYTDFDYTEHQMKLILLKKTKIRISTGEILDSYISKSYKPDL